LSIYFCIKADKLGAKGVRDKIFEFVTEKKSKALAKWLESEAPGVFKLENVPGSAIVNIICSTKETTPVLLPDKEWQQILDTPNEYFSSIFFREILSLVGITYKNNENNKLIMKIESELLINSNNPISGFNKALQTIIKALFIETNIVKKHQILKSCWDSTSLNNVSQICPDFDNKRIFINVNPDSRDGFKTSILENANLLETFIEKQVLNYDGIVPYLPKQYLFYQNDFKKILEDGSFKYDNKFKKDFNKVFDKSCLHIENNLFCKPENSSAKYLGDAYPLVSSIIMIFAVLPTFFLQFSFLGAALFSILSIALAVVGGYYVFRLTGRIPRNLRDRRERAFYRELYTDFTTAISNNSLGGKKMVLDFQNQVPIRLLQGKAKYIIYMSGLMKYFKLDLISVKSLDKDWEDVVRSLMYGQMLGNLGNFSLSKEQIHKLSELMSMIVILDILIEQHGQPLEYLLGKVQTYYGLKGN